MSADEGGAYPFGGNSPSESLLSRSPPDDDEGVLPLPCFENQVAGHKGISYEGGAILVPEPGRIAKPVGRGYFAGEDRFYRALSSAPALAQFCPAYFGTHVFGGRDYVVLEDLTHGMERPHVVDIKVGTCTVAPDAPWTKRITHLAKDRATTTRSLGLRVTGVQTSLPSADGRSRMVRLGKSWGKALNASDMSAALRTCFSADGALCIAALDAFLPRLRSLAAVLENGAQWQLVSSSLLFVFDAPAAGASGPMGDPPPSAAASPPARTASMRIIDFAHAYPIRSARDAGYLYGLRNLIELLSTMVEAERRAPRSTPATPPSAPPSALRASPATSSPLHSPCGAAVPGAAFGGSGALASRSRSRSGSGEGEGEGLVGGERRDGRSGRTMLKVAVGGTSAGAPRESGERERRPSMDEYAVPLLLSDGEVGCRWQMADGSVPPEATSAAASEWVTMYADEFVEAFAHSHLGHWSGEWHSFRSDLTSVLRPSAAGLAIPPEASPALPSHDASSHAVAGAATYAPNYEAGTPGRPDSPHSPSSPRDGLKHLVFEPLYRTYTSPNAISFRISPRMPRGDAEASANPAGVNPLAPRVRARVDIVLCGVVLPTMLPLHSYPSSSDGHSDVATDDALDQHGAALRHALTELVSGLAPAHAAAVLAAWVAQLGALLTDLAEGSYFQFGAATLWCLYDGSDGGVDGAHAAPSAPSPEGAEGAAGTRGRPVVRLSHFEGATMHREEGYNPAFFSALALLHRTFGAVCDERSGSGSAGGDAVGAEYDDEMELHPMSDV